MSTTGTTTRIYHWGDDLIDGEAALHARTEQGFAQIQSRMGEIDSIAWDTCHKIYVALDSNQTDALRRYGYGDGGEGFVYANDSTPERIMQTLRDWYDDSCGLRFIQGCSGPDTDTEWVEFIPQIFVTEE